ncbi:MAG TPA: prolyl oligopeptidase family serine peptidase [Acidimicrobiales bacterium]|nr:prolyl oligopeptidase family serine peptidase [Acidimicrobiales bacterium]
MNYPDAKRLDIVDVIHGQRVADPYRWLEDPDADDTKAWAAAQDALALPRLADLPGRDALAERLRELMPGLVGSPYVIGDRSFFVRRRPEEEHAVLWLRDGDGTERPLVDPNTLSDDATTTLDGWSPSKEGDRLAHQLSEGGDEESVVRVIDVATGELLDGPIDRCRYSPIAWLPGGEEFFYVRRLAPDQVPEGESQYHRRVYRHRVGADPATDDLIFGEGDDKTAYYDVRTSRDGRWLIVGRSLGTAPRNDLYIADLTSEPLAFATIHEGEDIETGAYVSAIDGRLYLFTNADAPRSRLCVADPADPARDNWQTLIPEGDAVLADFALTTDGVVAVHSRHAVSEITVYDKTTGTARHRVELPSLGSADVTSRPEGGDDVWIGYTDFVTPYRVFHYDLTTRALEPWADPPGAVDVKGVVADQITYQSKDGTDVRLFVLHKEDTTANGARPTVLYGYGGFNIPLTPAYSSTILAWVEAGGVYAVANLRGGSEEGEAWHRAGMRGQKQNVFDDFIAAGEWLVANGWTSPDHLGIMGGSNGGLLVGATLTQRPDLFSAVVCSAPLLDMIRYEQFGLGESWNDEYGTVAESNEFFWLLGYSPYHRVTPETAYPAVLFTVFESDSRVDPNHARKMCAALQAATTSPRPVLLRREVDVGHAGRSVSRFVALYADELAFLASELGLALNAV